MDCITYLKEKKGAPETFIPLETIRAHPVREALRQLNAAGSCVGVPVSAFGDGADALAEPLASCLNGASLHVDLNAFYHTHIKEKHRCV